MSNNCRAKTPSSCRFHGHNAYKDRMGSIAFYEEALKKSENFNQYEIFQARIAKYTLEADATETGMKKLQKAFQKSLRSGTPEEQIRLANRIKDAVSLRVELDGQDRDWEDAWDQGSYGFTSLALKKGAESSEVLIPTGNGTQEVSYIADRLAAEDGYVVTGFKIRYIGGDELPSEERKTEDEARLVRIANAGGLRKWLMESEELEGKDKDGWIYLEGVSYADPNGREVLVRCRDRRL